MTNAAVPGSGTTVMMPVPEKYSSFVKVAPLVLLP